MICGIAHSDAEGRKNERLGFWRVTFIGMLGRCGPTLHAVRVGAQAALQICECGFPFCFLCFCWVLSLGSVWMLPKNEKGLHEDDYKATFHRTMGPIYSLTITIWAL